MKPPRIYAGSKKPGKLNPKTTHAAYTDWRTGKTYLWNPRQKTWHIIKTP